jgi:hypothetical protein
LFALKQTDEAIEKLTEALHIYEGLKVDPPLVAEVHFHFSECLEERGDLSAALRHALLSKKLREKAFGLNDSRSVDSFRLVARLLLAPYQNYHGVVTPPMRKAYAEAILCLEKVFRYLKSAKTARLSNNNSAGSNLSESALASSLRLPFDTDLFISERIAGPLVSSPFGPKLPIPRALLHNLTKEIVRLKLTLVESPKHREAIRSIRAGLSETNDFGEETIVDPAEAKSVILRLAAVSPSIYLDGILQRVDDDDMGAIEELKVLLLLTEFEMVGLSKRT